MTGRKTWLRSRLVWLGILTTLLSLIWLALVLFGHRPPGWLLGALGALWGPITIWLRKTTTKLLGELQEADGAAPASSTDPPKP